ncbi:hypothetical protein Celaphus_00019608 [Cervus elaphus hippelaphus]|uniref:Uncharacterized protein n=1 Tax=Cervus elaphus hippelaphus TaxID=46360 RepID=A0A212BZ49_CEREH|nr:hypothetical protein Celaphus_00019608 [Cervus elaphus hippelaphus]
MGPWWTETTWGSHEMLLLAEDVMEDVKVVADEQQEEGFSQELAEKTVEEQGLERLGAEPPGGTAADEVTLYVEEAVDSGRALVDGDEVGIGRVCQLSAEDVMEEVEVVADE